MLSDLRFRLRAVFARADMERDLDDELRFHLAREAEKHIARGIPRAEAERRARLTFGGVDRIKDDTRDVRGIRLLDSLQQDLRYAWRGIVAKPGFAAAVMLALALGIGANTVMFGVVDKLLFRPPAYLVSPARVHRVYFTWLDEHGESTQRTTEYTRYADLTRWTSSFDKTAVVSYRTAAVGSGTDTRDMTIAAAAASFFDFFDARPQLGRFYTASEDLPPAGTPVVVISDAFWTSHFGRRADVIGTRIHVANGIFTIIGVAPPGFVGVVDDRSPALFAPVTAIAGLRSTRFYTQYTWGWLEMFARRKPGVSVATADADLTAAYRRSWEAERAISELPPLEKAKPRATAGSIHLSRGPEASPESRMAAWVMGVAAIVLLVACANVANLLLARALSRRREIGLRVALGVSRARLVQQLITESVVLSALGGLVGLIIAYWGGKLMTTLLLQQDATGSLATDGRTLAFALLTTITVSLLVGLAPVAHALRADVTGALKGGPRDGSYRQSRIASSLLLFQGALSVVLLVGAGLFTRSLSNVRSMRLGYDIDPILVVEGNPRGVKLTDAEQDALNARLLQAAQNTPGVESATLAASIPFWSTEGRGVPIVPGRDSLGRLGHYLMQAGSPTYFKTVGTRILQGRGFLDSDRAETQKVAVISQRMAELLWPGESAVGKQFRLDSDTTPPISVVGVAETMRARLISDNGEIWYYLPASQYGAPMYMQLFVRIRGNATDAVNTLRARLQPLMPGPSYVNVTPLSTMVGRVQRSWELGAKMFVSFGGLALLLAAIGLYSVIAYAVAQRTRELGVRIALGASAANVLRMIIGQGVTFALVGILIGSVVALWAGRWIEPLLFNQSARDPRIYVAAGIVLLIVALVASAKPALRAMRVDPSEVLRGD